MGIGGGPRDTIKGPDCGGRKGIGGIWDGRRPDCARKDKAVIHNPCRSADTAVNFRARAGVRIRIDLLYAERSSGFFGSGILS